MLNLNTLIIRKKGNILFNDALNTFYLRLYGVKALIINAAAKLLFVFVIFICLLGVFFCVFLLLCLFVGVFGGFFKYLYIH